MRADCVPPVPAFGRRRALSVAGHRFVSAAANSGHGAELLHGRLRRSRLPQPGLWPTPIMNSETKATLSNNNLRRMQGWARAVYPGDWQDRSAVVIEYRAQLDEDTAAALIKKGWPDVFATAE